MRVIYWQGCIPILWLSGNNASFPFLHLSCVPTCLHFFWNIYWTIIMFQNIRLVLGDWLAGEDGDFENKWNSVCVLEDLYSL